MEKIVMFIKLYFPMFLHGAVLGKIIELSGSSELIVVQVIRFPGRTHVNAVMVVACAIFAYGGVSLFVLVFAVCPLASELCRRMNIPKPLMPSAVALGAFSFAMDFLLSTSRIQKNYSGDHLQKWPTVEWIRHRTTEPL